MTEKRFEYTRLSHAEFNALLRDINMPVLSFARIFGVNPRTAKDWSYGDKDLPPWVFPVLRMMANSPGAIPEARRAAGDMIRSDSERPGVMFPYLNTSLTEF